MGHWALFLQPSSQKAGNQQNIMVFVDFLPNAVYYDENILHIKKKMLRITSIEKVSNTAITNR